MKRFLLVFMLFGCSSLPEPEVSNAKVDDAPKMYQQAMVDFKDGLYPEAIKTFEEIKNHYPYSEYATRADLRIGDAYFKQDKFAEAVEAYRSFLRYHPDHKEAPYAAYQIAESFWQQIPSDWWFLPPNAEKDQHATSQAITAYGELISQYPQSDYVVEARERLIKAKRKLADHEMYVAEFYFKRKAYKAAAIRADGILINFPDVGLEPKALWIIARSQRALGDKEAESKALDRLVSEFSQTEEGKEAAKVK